ncbi:MAG TPA: alpha-L-fucosidase [Lacipirellulaceae bacterium]|nr:alpha-L-fucosidase [Lacipirellulaceae bacterium]
MNAIHVFRGARRRHNLVLTAVMAALLAAAGSTGPPSACGGESAGAPDLEIAAGSFEPSAESLQKYECPEWYRDAKFGIWSHWGPQAVPRQGDWYARNMYLPGHRHYDHHIATYGHPSEHGYKDIIPLWTASKWDPEALMARYAKAGAKYFVSMGVHHDNFSLWHSKNHRWNAVEMGPKRNVVAEWQAAARKEGLRFGVSEHLGASYAWWAPSHGYDQFGPKAGVPYDGADPKYESLYHPAHNEPFRWGPTWYASDPAFHRRWFDRVKDLIDQHQPDLLYTDGGIPFGVVGEALVAHYYNSNQAAHGGRLEAVYNYKALGTGGTYPGAGVLDVERGVMPEIIAEPWQTCTSIGDWFYSEGYDYKSTAQIVHMLADIVSKNGNLLINVVQYPEGDLPPESSKFLDEMGAWMSVNGEAIYGTRPWKVFGEGPTEVKAGYFQEGTVYTAQDIRFTTKKGAIYAIALGVPSEETRIASLGRSSPHAGAPVAEVTLVGSGVELQWEQTPEALVIKSPERWPAELAVAFRITLEGAK